MAYDSEQRHRDENKCGEQGDPSTDEAAALKKYGRNTSNGSEH
jgi:hypothetical protein